MNQQHIRFSCQFCQTELRVPASMQGITGPCPECGNNITAPAPTEQTPGIDSIPASTAENPPQQPQAEPPRQIVKREISPAQMQPRQKFASPKERRRWPFTLAICLLILLVVFFAAYLLLKMAGVLPGSDQPEPVTPTDHTPTDHTPTDHTPPATISSVQPDLNSPADLPGVTAVNPLPVIDATPDLNPPKPVAIPDRLPVDPDLINPADEVPSDPLTQQDRPEKNRDFQADVVTKANEVLKKFLSAKTLEERMAYMEKPKRISMEQLSGSILAGQLPKYGNISLFGTASLEAEKLNQILFTVPFEDANDPDHQELVSVALFYWGEGSLPKVNPDAFLDVYGNALKNMAKKPVKGAKMFNVIIKYSSYCWDDVPDSDNKATIKFLRSFSRTESVIATAYLDKNSDIYTKIRQKIKADEIHLGTMSLEWNTQEDATNPFLEVRRFSGFGWHH